MQGETTKQKRKGTLSHYKGKFEMSSGLGITARLLESVVFTVTCQRQVTILAFSKV